MTRPTVSDKRAAFREMHHAGCFLLPNPWDAGSARLLERLGYRALATTSAGYPWSQGQADGQLSRDDTLAHMRYMAAMSDLPINADFESGFGATPEAVFDSVSLALETGVAGPSIEDSTGDPAQPVRDKAQAVERLQAARAAIDAGGGDTLLVGRAENYFIGRPDLDDTVERLLAYSQAGADCLYAPGLRTREDSDGRPGNRAEAGERTDRLEQRADRRGAGRAWRQAHQCRRCPGAGSLGRVHRCGAEDDRTGAVRWIRRHAIWCGTQRAVARHGTAALTGRAANMAERRCTPRPAASTMPVTGREALSRGAFRYRHP